MQRPSCTLLLVFIHGFKGHDVHTFLGFPDRVQTIFTNSGTNLDVESIVYPQYDTRGDFNVSIAFSFFITRTISILPQYLMPSIFFFSLKMSELQLAVSAFAEWIQTQVKEREAYNARAYGPSKTTTETEAKKEPVTIPPVYVCILGHSMGGLVGKKKK
jgi:hypothetical protein